MCRSLCTTSHWKHARMLQSLLVCPSPVTNQGTIGACRVACAVCTASCVLLSLVSLRVHLCVASCAACTPRGVLVVGPVVCVSREDHPPPLTQAGSALDRPAPHDD